MQSSEPTRLLSTRKDHVFLRASHEENAHRTRWVVALTAVMMVGGTIAGTGPALWRHSPTAFQMATNAGALAVAALAHAYARRHARNPVYSFGNGKVGDLAGFALAMILGSDLACDARRQNLSWEQAMERRVRNGAVPYPARQRAPGAPS